MINLMTCVNLIKCENREIVITQKTSRQLVSIFRVSNIFKCHVLILILNQYQTRQTHKLNQGTLYYSNMQMSNAINSILKLKGIAD